MLNFLRNSLRDAVFGIQDGLVSTLGALTGIAVGTQNRNAVAIAGLVIITVESLSMAAGSYLSSKSQKQLLERMLKDEEESIEKDPQGEKKEIWEMYRARHYTDKEIAMIEKRLFSDKKLLLEDMAHKELGICPRTLEEPGANAVVMGVSYVVGGMIPMVPYLIFSLPTALPVSVLVTVGTLFVFGGLKGMLVKQPWWRSGLEMLFVAGLAGAAGYFIGRLAGNIYH
jgi:predicted membrane protein (TIGR00267 family)